MILVGVISDTHGLLRPQALAALRGCAHVIHGGDIGDAAILRELSTLAPLTVVRGNNDTGEWAAPLPEIARVTLGGVDCCVVHDLKQLSRDDAGDARVIISGHSHKPEVREDDARLYLNPGSAGPRRFKLPVSVALLEIAEARARARIVELPL